MINMFSLNLSYNKIEDVSPLKGMAEPSELYLDGNPIPQRLIDELAALFPECETLH